MNNIYSFEVRTIKTFGKDGLCFVPKNALAKTYLLDDAITGLTTEQMSKLVAAKINTSITSEDGSLGKAQAALWPKALGIFEPETLTEQQRQLCNEIMDDPAGDWSCAYSDLGMFSGTRPSSIVWSYVAYGLISQGCAREEVERYLKSKCARWALDGLLGDALNKVAFDFGRSKKAVEDAKSLKDDE